MRFDWLFILIAVFVLAITIIMGASPRAWVNIYSVPIVALMFLVICDDCVPDLLETFNEYLLALIIINLLCMLIWPKGMYVGEATGYTKNWILGYKSSLQYYFFPAIVISRIEFEYGKVSRFRYFIVMALGVVEAILGENVMLIGGIILITLLRHSFTPRKCSSGMFLAIVGSANIVLLFYSSSFLNSRLGMNVLAFFNRSVTLGGRISIIWPKALQLVKQKLLFGYGVLDYETHRELLGIPAAIHAHNQFLEFALTGGVVLVALFLCWLCLQLKTLRQHRENNAAEIIWVSMFVFFIMSTVEVFARWSGFGVWLLLFLPSYVGRLAEQYKA